MTFENQICTICESTSAIGLIGEIDKKLNVLAKGDYPCSITIQSISHSVQKLYNGNRMPTTVWTALVVANIEEKNKNGTEETN